MLRLMTLGLCAANVVMLSTWQASHVEWSPAEPALASQRSTPEVRVVDVVYGLAPQTLAAALRLNPDERITALNDRALPFEPDTAVLFASLDARPGEFLDLTVSSATTERRLLVLMH